MNIRLKLILGFVGVVLILIVVNAINLYTGNNLINRFETLSNDDARALLALGQIEASLNRMQGEAVSIALILHEAEYVTGAELEEALAEVEDELIELDVALANVQRWTTQYRHTSPDNALLADQIKASAEDMYQVSLELVRLKQAGVEGSEILVAFEVLEDIEEDVLPFLDRAILDADGALEMDQVAVSATATNASLFNLIILVVAVLITGGGSFVLIRNVTNPIHKLQQAAQQIEAGDPHVQVDLDTEDEFARLAHAFNAMSTAITDRENSLTAANAQLQEANLFKAQMLANVSHDLRTPLGAVLGHAEMLKNGVHGPMDSNQQKFLNRIIHNTRGLTDMVNLLLVQSRLDAGTVQINMASLYTDEILEYADMNFMNQAESKKLELLLKREDTVPDTLVSDETRIQQIVQNLLGNALKFTTEGYVSLRLFCPDASHWAIEVADSGAGIPDNAHEYIFESFRQVDGTTTRKHGGSGLGLSIVQQLVTMMDGEITLNSAVGRGSTFTVTFPLILDEESVPAPEEKVLA